MAKALNRDAYKFGLSAPSGPCIHAEVVKVAGIKEMALGIASVLRSGSAPNPLPIDFKGYAPDDGAEFLRYLADECADAGILIKEVRADPAYVHQLTRSKREHGLVLRDTSITADPTCRGRLEIDTATLGLGRKGAQT